MGCASGVAAVVDDGDDDVDGAVDAVANANPRLSATAPGGASAVSALAAAWLTGSAKLDCCSWRAVGPLAVDGAAATTASLLAGAAPCGDVTNTGGTVTVLPPRTAPWATVCPGPALLLPKSLLAADVVRDGGTRVAVVAGAALGNATAVAASEVVASSVPTQSSMGGREGTATGVAAGIAPSAGPSSQV